MSNTSDQANGPLGFTANRREVLKVLVKVDPRDWGWVITFLGTTEELISTGVADEEMFHHIGKSGKRTARDEFGDRFQVSRRAHGQYLLERHLRHEDRHCFRPSEIQMQWIPKSEPPNRV